MKTITTVLEVSGLAAVVGGVALWSVPAALIVAGAALVALSWRLTGGGS